MKPPPPQSHELQLRFHNKQIQRKPKGTGPGVLAPPAFLRGAKEEGRERWEEGGEEWGSPGFPALRNAGISTAAPPRSARTHAREARERPPRHREGPRRQGGWRGPASRAYRGSPRLPPTVPRPGALTPPPKATPVSPLAPTPPVSPGWRVAS